MNKHAKKIDLSECEMVKININIAISYNHPTPILQVIRDYMEELKFIEPFNRSLEIKNIKITSMVAT